MEACKTLYPTPSKGAYFPLIQHNEQVELTIVAANNSDLQLIFESKIIIKNQGGSVEKRPIIKYFNSLYTKNRTTIWQTQSNYHSNTHTTIFCKIIFIPASKYSQQKSK